MNSGTPVLRRTSTAASLAITGCVITNFAGIQLAPQLFQLAVFRLVLIEGDSAAEPARVLSFDVLQNLHGGHRPARQAELGRLQPREARPAVSAHRKDVPDPSLPRIAEEGVEIFLAVKRVEVKQRPIRIEGKTQEPHHFHCSEMKVAQGVVADRDHRAVVQDLAVSQGKLIQLRLEVLVVLLRRQKLNDVRRVPEVHGLGY